MPRVPLIMPQLGESIAEATIVALPFKVGDSVEEDQDIMALGLVNFDRPAIAA